MENQEFQLSAYLTDTMERLVKDMVRSTLENPKESAFLARFSLSVREAAWKREKAEKRGESFPSFLIASITSSCNLHCEGCYSRHNHACTDEAPVNQLTAEDWSAIFFSGEGSGHCLYSSRRRRTAYAERRDRSGRSISGYSVSCFHKRNAFSGGLHKAV